MFELLCCSNICNTYSKFSVQYSLSLPPSLNIGFDEIEGLLNEYQTINNPWKEGITMNYIPSAYRFQVLIPHRHWFNLAFGMSCITRISILCEWNVWIPNVESEMKCVITSRLAPSGTLKFTTYSDIFHRFNLK